jgi:molybdopterin molybdotransferase
MSRIQPLPSPVAGVLPFEEARHLVEQQAKNVSPSEPETIDLLAASGRILAEDLAADRDFPPFARATRDGFAVRATDVTKLPARLEVIGELKAGDSPDRYLIDQAQAIAIMTGAPLPAGADAVVMVEHTSEVRDRETANAGKSPKLIDVHRGVNRGDNFVPRAAEAREGQPLLNRGHRLDYSAIAIAASVGKSQVQVFRKPRVAVLSTGDEVVDISADPGPAEIRNSNSYSLAAQIHNAGGEPIQLPIARDERGQLRALIEQGLSCDLLLLTGGVSMGKYDLVEQVLGDLKAEFYFTGAEIQPGRPVVFGACSDLASALGGAGALPRLSSVNLRSERAGMPAPHKKYFFGLPGNPVSTMVTFELFARPMIEALSGMTPRPLIFLSARLKSEIRIKTGLKRFLPAVLAGEFERAEVELTRWQGSGDIAAMARSNCYLVIPPDRERIEAGEWVSLLMR